MNEAKRFLDDWGVMPATITPDRLACRTRNGAAVIVRPIDAADLPPLIEPGNTGREVIWGAANAQELEQLRRRISGILRTRSLRCSNIMPTRIIALETGSPAASNASRNCSPNGRLPAPPTAPRAGKWPYRTRAAAAMPRGLGRAS
jgi:hypothetical protein